MNHLASVWLSSDRYIGSPFGLEPTLNGMLLPFFRYWRLPVIDALFWSALVLACILVMVGNDAGVPDLGEGVLDGVVMVQSSEIFFLYEKRRFQEDSIIAETGPLNGLLKPIRATL